MQSKRSERCSPRGASAVAVSDEVAHTAGMKRIVDFLGTFGLGYFFGLGAMALAHAFVGWPASYQEAAYLAFISGAGALGARLYNSRLVSPGSDE